MKEPFEVSHVQIIGSQESWQRLTQIRLSWWIRPILALIGTTTLALGIIGWVVSCLIRVVNILTCGWIRPLHHLSQRLMRRVRWTAILAFAFLISAINPSLALTLVMSYCMVRSFDFPEHWMQWILRFDSRRKL